MMKQPVGKQNSWRPDRRRPICFETEHIEERMILVGVDTGNPDAAERSLDELQDLAKDCRGAKTAGRLIQVKGQCASCNLYRQEENWKN